MRGTTFEAGETNQSVRDHLAARIGDYGEGAGELATNQWLMAFQTAFNSSADAETLITFDNIALALAEYQRSMAFVKSPWQDYLGGDVTALSNDAIEGAILFFSSTEENGAACVNCHSGSLFSDGKQHVVGFPQIGVGKEVDNNDDFGRERVSGDRDDRYRYRTPSLLNIAVTAPYGHAGAYQELDDVLRHYDNPEERVTRFFDNNELCDLPQFRNVAGCTSLYPNGRQNSIMAVMKLLAEQDMGNSQLESFTLNATQRRHIEAFLHSLTDPCVTDRHCMADWIAEQGTDNPDDNLLIVTDQFGAPL